MAQADGKTIEKVNASVEAITSLATHGMYFHGADNDLLAAGMQTTTTKARSWFSAVGSVALLSVACSNLHAATTEPAAETVQGNLSFHSPFHPDECVAAVREATRQLNLASRAPRWLRILGQGLLCLGLKDDPFALRMAIKVFRDVLDRNPADSEAQVGLADAYRKLQPLSREAQVELLRAIKVERHHPAELPLVDSIYLHENLNSIVARREAYAAPRKTGLLGDGRDEFTAQREAILDGIAVGAHGLAMAHRGVARLLHDKGARSSALVWIAELLRQKGEYWAATTLLTFVERGPCHAPLRSDEDCSLGLQRLHLLEERCAEWDQLAGILRTSPCRFHK